MSNLTTYLVHFATTFISVVYIHVSIFRYVYIRPVFMCTALVFMCIRLVFMRTRRVCMYVYCACLYVF